MQWPSDLGATTRSADYPKEHVLYTGHFMIIFFFRYQVAVIFDS